MKPVFLLVSLLVVTNVMGQGIVTGTGYASATSGNTVAATGSNTLVATSSGNTVGATSSNTVVATSSGNTVAATGSNTVGVTSANTVSATSQSTVAATGQVTVSATGTTTTNIVTIPPSQMAVFTFPGPLNSFTGTLTVTSGAAVDVLGFFDQNFTLFQSGQASAVRAFQALGVTTYTIPTLTVANTSVLYITVGNNLATSGSVGSVSTVQFQYLLQVAPTVVARPGAVTTTGAATGSNTGTVIIPLGTASVFTLPGPITGASASFNVANGVPVDVVLLLNQAYTNYLGGQPISAAFQVLNTLSTVVSPINVASGNTVFMLVGNNLISSSANARDADQATQAPVVSFTITGLQQGQIIVPTSIQKQISSASTAVATIATVACGLAIALL